MCKISFKQINSFHSHISMNLFFVGIFHILLYCIVKLFKFPTSIYKIIIFVSYPHCFVYESTLSLLLPPAPPICKPAPWINNYLQQ